MKLKNYSCAKCGETHTLPKAVPYTPQPGEAWDAQPQAVRDAADARNRYKGHWAYRDGTEAAAAIGRLRGVLQTGDKVYCTLRSVSRSGMYRVIDLQTEARGAIGYDAALALGYPWKGSGVGISGCGMDMGFALVDHLGDLLYPRGWKCQGKDCHAQHSDNSSHLGEPRSCAICHNGLPEGVKRDKHLTRKHPAGRAYRLAVCSEKCRRAPWVHRGYALRHVWA